MKLSITAEYIADKVSGDTLVVGDVTQVLVYLFDPSDSKYKPAQIASGFCELRYGTTPMQKCTFSRLYGNSDGSIKCVFNHPKVRGGSSVYAQVTLLDGSVLDDLVVVSDMPNGEPVPLSVQR